METEKIKFAGASAKMKKALKDEGLFIVWPKSSVVREKLAIEATFYTGADWEKVVNIDLRDKEVMTKGEVDNAIASQLREAYLDFDLDEEVSLNLEGSAEERKARGCPDAVRLIEDMQEQEKRLERFAEVAEAVAEGRKIPKEELKRPVLSGDDAMRVAGLLEQIARFTGESPWSHEDKAFAKLICDELRYKVKEG